MWLLFIWSLTFLGALVLYYRRLYSRFSDYGVNSLPATAPFGNLNRMVLKQDHMNKSVVATYSAFPEDRFVGFFEIANPTVMLRDPELIKQIAVKDFDNFSDHRTFVNQDSDRLFGRNLFSLAGHAWRDMRSTLSPAFTRSKMRMMVPFMVEVGDQMVATLKRKIQESGAAYMEEDAKNIATRYANDVIASCAFGLKIDSWKDQDNEFYQRGKVASTFGYLQLLKVFFTMSFPKTLSKFNISLFSQPAKDFFTNLVFGVMRDRKEKHIVRPDMIQLLMEVKKGNLIHDDNVPSEDAGYSTMQESDIGLRKHNRAWSDLDLVAQASLFFISGFETVSSTMTFTIMELAINPDAQDKLYQEIRENDKKNNGKFDFNSIQEMEYLDMVVSESMRIWPSVVTTDRICRENYNLGKANDKATEDYIIRKGEAVWFPMFAIHRDPAYWPEPMKFIPERFSKENQHKIKPFTYFPFGLGPRNCIGSRFAICEVKVMLYQLLRHFKFSPGSELQLPLEILPGSFSMKIRGGARLRLKIRN